MKSLIYFAVIKIYLIGILLFSNPLLSQVSTVRGNVSTSSIPVRYASIVFTDKNDTTKKFSTITDILGNYQIGIITTVENNSSIVPNSIELEQNYPNPFSSSTAISYQLNKQADVSVTIYDVLGREVKAFTVGLQTIGTHGVVWDGKNNFGSKVSTGIYFYRLQARNETQVKKMVLTDGGATTVSVHPIDRFFSDVKQLKKKTITQITGGTYTVQIANTDKTIPKILFSEFPNIRVRPDTTINFQVQEAEQWRYLGLENEIVTAIAVDPIDPKIIYVGTRYGFSAGILGKLFKSTDGGTTWDTLFIGGGYRDLLIDPLNHNILYASPGAIIKSEDGGQTWKPIINGIHLDFETRVQSLAMNPKNSNVLYAGTGGFFGGNLYKSYDGGLHWNKTSSDSLEDGVISIAIDLIDTNNIYAGTAWRGILWKSTDAGTTWFRTGLGETGEFILDIFIDPKTPSTIYAGVSWEGIFKTEDGGMNWENISQGLSATRQVVKIQQSKSSRLFLVAAYGDSGGIYEYSLPKNEWNKIGIDAVLDSYYYSDLKIISSPNKLYFGGKGMYVMDLKE